MPTNKAQLAQQQRFTAAYFNGDESVRGKLKEAALAAGYSKTTLAFKQGKLRRIINAEAQRRSQSRRPSVFRDPNTGKISFEAKARELQAERSEVQAASELPESGLAPSEDSWWRDPINGSGTILDLTIRATPRRLWTLANSYCARYVGLDGELHFSGDEFKPEWSEPDFSEFFLEPWDGEQHFVDEQENDLLGEPDRLPQARLRPDEGTANQIFSQVVVRG